MSDTTTLVKLSRDIKRGREAGSIATVDDVLALLEDRIDNSVGYDDRDHSHMSGPFSD